MLTGRYSMRYGLQSYVITYESKYALTLKENLLSQELKNHGYSTHLVGKWHLGHMSEAYLPTNRGFDSFFGYLGGQLHYYTYLGPDPFFTAHDLRADSLPHLPPDNSTYSLDFWLQHSFKVLDSLASSEDPFFLYVAWQGSHSPSESVQEDLQLYERGLSQEQVQNNSNRLNFQAQTTASDRLFEALVSKLKSLGLWQNSLLMFASDNGAPDGYGDNSPLQGEKSTIWEGGVRVPAFVSGGWLPENLRGVKMDSYPFHVVDWYPTLLAAAGLELTQKPQHVLDGKNLWRLMQMEGKDKHGTKLQDIEFENDLELMQATKERFMLINVNSDQCENDACGALVYGGRWKILWSSNEVTDPEGTGCFWERSLALSTNDILGCGKIPLDVNATDCMCQSSACLFDLDADPCEYYDVSEDHPDLTQKLLAKLQEFYDAQADPLDYVIGVVQNASVIDPSNNSFDGKYSYWPWGPWVDPCDWRDLEFEQYLDQFYFGNQSNQSSDENQNQIYAAAAAALDMKWDSKRKMGVRTGLTGGFFLHTLWHVLGASTQVMWVVVGVVVLVCVGLRCARNSRGWKEIGMKCDARPHQNGKKRRWGSERISLIEHVEHVGGYGAS